MTELTEYTVKVVQEAEMPEQWLRAHLDDMFGDDVVTWVEGSQNVDSTVARWECRDCGREFFVSHDMWRTECGQCGGGLSLEVVD